MLVSPSYFPQKKSPRSVNIELQLQRARMLEQAERDNKKEERKDENGEVKKQRTAIDIYKELADNEKSAESQYRFAEISIAQGNEETAFDYMKLAAEQKHRMAQCRLGEMYAHGIGVPKYEPSAIEWFQKAEEHSSDHSCPRALTNLGVMRYMGRGTVRDTMAGGADLLQAERSYLAQNQDGDNCFGQDVGENAFYLKPAKVLPTALYLLSKKYLAKNMEDKSSAYLKQAADAGHLLSKFVSNENFKKIDENDLQLLKQDAHDGCPDTAFFLGQLYCGVNNYLKQDISQAIHFFKLSADAGHTDAQSKLQHLELINDVSKLSIQ
jgi:TPR repeat protein